MKTFLHHILDYGDILLLLVAFFAPNPRKFPGVCALRNDGEQGPFSSASGGPFQEGNG